MTIYTVTTLNWDNPSFWSGISETGSGHTLDFSSLGSGYTIDFNTTTAELTVSDGTTSFLVVDSTGTGLPYDAIMGGSTILDFFNTLIAPDGNSYANGSSQADTLTGGAGNDSLYGNAGNDHLKGNAGNDSIVGGEGNDSLYGNGDNDTLDGGNGDDFLVGGLGADSLIGGAGNDVADYSLSGYAVNVDLTTGLGTGGEAQGDTLSGVENIYATNHNDTLTGDAEANQLSGYSGDDSIFGGGGRDTLTGHAGNDTLDGGDADDFITGGNGADSLTGGAGNDILGYLTDTSGVTVNLVTGTGSGGEAEGDTVSGFEYIYAGAGSDHLTGDSGNNFFRAYAGNDTIIGGDGNDSLFGMHGADSLDGGAGIDIAMYDSSFAGVTVNLVTGLGSGGTAEGDTLSGIENLSGSIHDDHLTGDGNANHLNSYGGADTLEGGAGNDTLQGSYGADSIDGGDGHDISNYGSSNAGITINLTSGRGAGGEAEGDTITGIEQISGTGHDDLLIGSATDEIFTGFGGNETIEGRGGADTLQGSAGDDWLSYASSDAAVTVNLGSNSASGGHATGDNISGFENLLGSEHNDSLTGANGGGILDGGLGDDTLTGGTGNDHLIGGGYSVAGTGNVSPVFTLSRGEALLSADGRTALAVSHGGNVVVLQDNNSDGVIEEVPFFGSDLTTAEMLSIQADGNIVAYSTDVATFNAASDGTSYIVAETASDTLVPVGESADYLSIQNDGDIVFYATDASAFYNRGTSASGVTTVDLSPGDDSLSGGDGDDTLEGGGGNDILQGGAGADSLDGGDGNDDYATYYSATAAVAVDLSTGLGSAGDAAGDTLTGIEHLAGSNHDDTLTGDAADNTFYGYDGNDTVLAGDGRDSVIGGGGADSLDGGGGIDDVLIYNGSTSVNVNISTNVVSGGHAEGDTISGFEHLVGSQFNDTLTSDAGINYLFGNAGDDLISLGADNDLAQGGAGNDTLHGGAGADSLDGGDGLDVTSYSGSGAAVTVDIALQTVSGGDADGDTIVSIEGAEGSSFSDSLTGDSGANLFYGGDGVDTLIGADGDDSLGGEGGNDQLLGGAGNDLLQGGAGADSIEGGNDADTILGGADADTLKGDAGADLIIAGTGADRVEGGSGNDTIYGMDGSDILKGGDGNDLIRDSLEAAPHLNGVMYPGDVLLRGQLLVSPNGKSALYMQNDGNAVYCRDIDGDGNWEVSASVFGAHYPETQMIQVRADGYVVALDERGSIVAQIGDGGTGDNFRAQDDGNFVYYDSSRLSVNVLYSAATNADLSPYHVLDLPSYSHSSSDILQGDAGDDTLIAGAGNDNLSGGAGADSLDGGADRDWAQYATSSGAVAVNLATGTGTGGDAEGDTLTGIENILGSHLNDTITGDAADNYLSGNIGSDTLIGGDGNDTLHGGQSGDSLDGGAGIDWVDYQYSSIGMDVDLLAGTSTGGVSGGDTITGVENIIASFHDDTLSGDNGANEVSGRDGADLIKGLDGADTLSGDAQNDTLEGGAGADSLDGGSGDDWASYAGSTASVNVNIATNTHSGGDAQGDTLTNIENLEGSDLNDTLTGDGTANQLKGNAGSDSLVGGDGNDTLTGDAGNDTLDGGAGADSLDGGADLDWVDYSASNSAVTVNLSTGTGSGGHAEQDTLTGVENVLGSTHNDSITGDTGENILSGGDGNDTLIAGAGNDTLTGGTGNDTLTGGDGDDVFTYAAGDGHDTITDFNSGNSGTLLDADNTNNDRIDLSAFYDGMNELRADYSDDGILNQSNTTTLQGHAVDYSNNASFGSGSLSFTGGAADNTFFTSENTMVPCFTPGTLIKTADGEVDVADLRPGDLVLTRDNGYQEVHWVGAKKLSGEELRAAPNLAPLRIRAGALGRGAPERDMIVSPQHRVVMGGAIVQLWFGEDEVLVAATHLVGRSGIERISPAQGVCYVHIMFAHHELVMSDGTWTESFQPGNLTLAGLDQDQRDELLTLFPELMATSGQRSYHAVRPSLKSYQARLLTAV